MNKQLCFIIENKSLYLEQVLVDYMDIPIFFLCKAENQYYIALCTEMNELSYIVTKLSVLDVYNLLHGRIPMRDVILKQNEYWEIMSGNEIYLDTVTKKSIGLLKKDLLPEEKACFKILTEQMQLFVQKFDCDFLADEYFSGSGKQADLSELSDFSIDALIRYIDWFTKLASINVKNPISSIEPLYNEKMEPIKESEVVFRNSDISKQTELDDLFELTDSFTNCITDAA